MKIARELTSEQNDEELSGSSDSLGNGNRWRDDSSGLTQLEEDRTPKTLLELVYLQHRGCWKGNEVSLLLSPKMLLELLFLKKFEELLLQNRFQGAFAARLPVVLIYKSIFVFWVVFVSCTIKKSKFFNSVNLRCFFINFLAVITQV